MRIRLGENGLKSFLRRACAVFMPDFISNLGSLTKINLIVGGITTLGVLGMTAVFLISSNAFDGHADKLAHIDNKIDGPFGEAIIRLSSACGERRIENIGCSRNCDQDNPGIQIVGRPLLLGH